jgi:uncharacterized repeat protein (TIGR03803 family)
MSRNPVAFRTFVVAIALAAGAASGVADAKSFAVIDAFKGGNSGAYPGGTVIFDQAGNMYGTTGDSGRNDVGTIFRLAPDGKTTTLYSFKGGVDGAGPNSPLLMDGAGNLYGTTAEGGNQGCEGTGCGTVFELSPGGREKVLYAFDGGGSDGAFPLGGLIADGQGDLYGTTAEGGIDGCSDYPGCGVIFEVAPGGAETVLYRFTGGNDGGTPLAGLVADSNFNLYGTAGQGGANALGVVYELAGGNTLNVLHAFSGNDGAFPESSLIFDKAGNLYGTTSAGGGQGVVFELAPDGTETVLYSFTGGADGAYPHAGVFADRAFNLYGTTTGGGENHAACGGDCGVVFRLAPDGTETVLHAFTGDKDGFDPVGALTAAPSGVLAGTATGGGVHNYGTVFTIRK